MRRGMNMNRQRGGYSGSGGSESHLSNQLHNLDMELELLKRKREIIEKEQNMFNRFSSNTKRQNDYEQPFYTYNQQEPKQHHFNVDSFSSAYEASSSSNYNKPQGNKRQSNINWQNQNPSPPKRFNATQRINPWQSSETSQDYIPLNQNYKPQHQPKNFSAPHRLLLDNKPSISQKMKNRYVPPPPRKDFRPTKVTKNKTQPYPPKKPINQPLEHTQKLISEANKIIAHTNKVTNKTSPNIGVKPQVTPTSNLKKYNILYPDKPPTVQMKGRLELALGRIVKDIREQHCTDPKDLEFFTIPFIQRLIKHTLRTRIRNVNMNEVIDSVNDIVNRYRKKYPMETDNELMNIVRDAQKFTTKNHSVGLLTAADDPEYFFRKNTMRVIMNKFNDMLADLRKLYEEKTCNFEEYIQQFAKDTEKMEADNKSKINEENEEGNNQKESDDKVNTNPNSDDIIYMTDDIGNTFSKIKHYAEFLDRIIDQRLPKILSHFKDVLLTMCVDREFLGIKALIVAETKQKLIKGIENGTITIDDDDENESQAESNRVPKRKLDAKTTDEPAITSKKTTSTLDATSSNIPATSITPSTLVPSKSPNKPSFSDSETLVPSTSMSITEASAKDTQHASLPPENSTSAKSAMSVADVSHASCNKPVPSVTPSKSIITNIVDLTAPSTPLTPAADKSATTPATPASKDIRYVKLIGRPSLPARAVIYEFLKKFNPSSIKKHKSINNLLVIGFTDQAGFEKILAANESVVGDATVIIKASEQVATTPVQKKVDTPIHNKGIDIKNADTPSEQVTNTPSQKKVNEANSDTVQQNQPLVDTPGHKKGTNILKNADTSVDEAKMNDSQTKSSGSLIQNKADDSLNNVDSHSDLITADLDNQITDLLSSIRKADEENTVLEDQIRPDCDQKVDAPAVSHTAQTCDENSKTSDETKPEVEKASTTQDSTTKHLETIAETGEDEKVSDVNEEVKTVRTEDSTELGENGDKVSTVTHANLKESGRATPTRSSARLANTTPSIIKTRRASRLTNETK